MAAGSSDQTLATVWLQSHNLTVQTIQCLFDNGFDTLAALKLLRVDDLQALPINLGQRRLIENCLTEVPGSVMNKRHVNLPIRPVLLPQSPPVVVPPTSINPLPNTSATSDTTISLINKMALNNLDIDTSFKSEPVPYRPPDDQEIYVEKVLSYKHELLRNSPKIAAGIPAIHKVVLREIVFDRANGLRRCQIGNDAPPGRQEKVLMLVGATGTGKSTLINSIANYILGVDWKDPFRFKIIVEEDEATTLPANAKRLSHKGQASQAHSQTKCITAYTFCLPKDVLPYKLTIVDTPGFGDTEGIERDVQITKQIRHLFDSPRSDSLDYINAVGIIDKASSARLTHCQRYIFDSVLSLFGRDMEKNIFVLATFSDGKEPLVQTALNEARVPYAQLFKINNSAFFSQHNQSDDDFDALFWKMGNKSLQKFFIEFEKSESRSLYQTKEVLKQRQKLEVHVENLQQRVIVAHAKLDQITQEEAVIAQNRQAIDKSKQFTYSVDIIKNVKIDLEVGQFVTNCLTCNRTCHFPCALANDEEKYNCAAMNKHTADATCTECPGNCSWKMHKNNTYRFETVVVKEIRTDSHLKTQYESACANKTKSEAMLDDLRKQYKQVEDEAFKMLVDLNNCTNRLSEIALKPNPLSTVDYIDLLIESEKQEHRPGYLQRIDQLKAHRKRAELLRVANKGSGVQTLKELFY